jgi:hypothetical protein
MHIAANNKLKKSVDFIVTCECRLTKKAEPPPTRDVNRDSGTESANGGWLRRLVRPQNRHNLFRRRKSKMPWTMTATTTDSVTHPTSEMKQLIGQLNPSSQLGNVLG